MSVATVPLNPSANVISSLAGSRLHGATTAAHGLPREYEVLPRLVGAMTSCAPSEVATKVADLLRPFVGFEIPDNVNAEADPAEVLKHSVAGTQLHPGNMPI